MMLLTRATASAAGLFAAKPMPDLDGVDWIVGHPGAGRTGRSPKIELQVKTWSGDQGDREFLRFRIRARHFNALAGPGYPLPRYLVLVTVPSDIRQYARCDAECMALEHAAYWLSLADREPLVAESPGSSVAVAVPTSSWPVTSFVCFAKARPAARSHWPAGSTIRMRCGASGSAWASVTTPPPFGPTTRCAR
jgi:hypothetical protein